MAKKKKKKKLTTTFTSSPDVDDLESRADYHDYDYVDDDYSYHGGDDYHLYEGEIFRDVDYLERPKIVRNPRDHRYFPGIVPGRH